MNTMMNMMVLQDSSNNSSNNQKLTKISDKLEECNYIKYPSYRVAMKLHVLEIICNLQEMPLTLVERVFDSHKLKASESSLCLKHSELQSMLYNIYYAAKKHNHFQGDMHETIDQMIAVLYDIFSRNGKGSIQVLSVKLLLAVLSNSTLAQFYLFLFNLCADHNNCVTRSRLQIVLNKMMEILRFLREDITSVNSSLQDCFVNSPGFVGINEGTFINWLENRPKMFCWVPELHKLRASETVIQAQKCSCCKETPLVGLIFKCTKCAHYFQCQHCYFTERISYRHKLSHRMKEISAQKCSKSRQNILKKLLRVFRCSLDSHHQEPSAQLQTLRNIFYSTDKVNLLHSRQDLSDLTDLPLQNQLQIVIQQLESQSKDLQLFMTTTRDSQEIVKYVEAYRIHVALQVQRLIALKNNFKINEATSLKVKFRENDHSDNLNVPDPDMLHLAPGKIHNVEYNIGDEGYISKSEDVYKSNSINTKLAKFYDNTNTSCFGGGHTSHYHESGESQHYSKNLQLGGLHSNLDDALAKLQQILANNFSLEDTLVMDNDKLKCAVSEVEGMLSTFMDNVEANKADSGFSVKV